MVEESEYRDAYERIKRHPCPFEKNLQAGGCGCRLARRFWLADREGVGCDSGAAAARCGDLLEALRQAARFTLRRTDIAGPLPHAKEIRVQAGGLTGLAAALSAEHPRSPGVEDVDSLVSAAVAHWGSLAQLPLEETLPHIAAYQGRRRRNRGKGADRP